MNDIKKEIYDFCILNEITDMYAFEDECIRIGFMTKKYGNRPDIGIIKKVETVEQPVLNKETNNLLKINKKEDDYGVYDK